MLLQVLHGNTAINHLRHLSDLPFTAGVYTHFNQLIRLQVDVLIRKHQRIITDFKPGREHQTEGGKYGYLYGVARSKWIKAISKEDQIIQWFKPKSKPKSATKEEFDALPSSITIRELRYEVTTPDFRSSEIIIFTTLTDEV